MTCNPRLESDVSQATATNVYLMLYPRPAVQAAWGDRPDLMDDLWALLRQIGQDELLLEGRTYGGGLNKPVLSGAEAIEPRELARVRLPDVPWLRELETEPRQLVLWER